MKNYLWHWKRLVAVFLIVIMMTPDISGIVAYANPDSGDTTEVETVTETVSETESEDEPEGEISESEEAESEGEPEGESESESQSESVNESEEEEAESVSETETDSVVETESSTEIETETMTETETETVMETTLEAEDDSNIRYIHGRELTEEEIAEMKAMEPKYLPELNMPKVPELAPGKNYLKSSNLPETYDARDEDIVTGVKDQNPYGTCWSFGSISAMETSMIAQGLADVDNIDISERHLAYFARHTGTDELGNADKDTIISSGTDYLYVGGNVYDFSMKMLNWHGGAKESDFPYSSVEEEISASLGQVSDAAHLKNAYILSTNAKEEESRALLKELVYKYKSVAASYYHSSEYLNYSTAAYYNNNNYISNHLICVVGWDDSYAKENFNSGNCPDNDGAWIVKNSWGDDWLDAGYMYISYEDASFADDVVMAVVASSSDDYDNNYFYGNTTSWSFENALGFAQVFEIKGKDADKEQLRAVSVMNYTPGIQYSLQLYKNPDEVNGVVQNPESGTALLNTPITGTITYAGVNQIELPEPITVEVDDKISVVLTSTSGDYMMLFTDTTYTETYSQHINVSAAGQSFRKLSTSGGWSDLHNSIESAKINLFTTDYSETVMTPEVTVSVNKQPSGFDEPLEYLIKWKRCTGAVSYDILKAENIDGNYSVIASVGSNERVYIDSIAEEDWEKTLYYKVRANFDGGSLTESEVAEISAEVILKPEMKSYVYGSDDIVMISWKPFANADGYELQKKNAAGNYITVATLTDATKVSYEEDYSQADLGKYEYRVRAYKGETYSEWSDAEIVYKDIEISQVGTYEVEVKWYSRDTSYTSSIRCLTSTGWNFGLNFGWSTNQWVWDLEENVTYGRFKLGDICKFYVEITPESGGNMYSTNTLSLCMLPEKVSVSGTYEEDKVNLKLSGGEGAETVFVYRSKIEGDDGTLIASISDWNSDGNYTDDVAEYNNTTLYYTVYSSVVNSSNEVILGEPSYYSVKVNGRKFNANISLEHPDDFSDTADYTISWTGCSDADSYKILRSTQENGEYSTIAEVQAGENSYVDSVSVSDWSTKYYYKVSALYEGEEPTVTNAVSVSELPTLACSTPSAVYDNNEIRLAWDAIAGADGYSIERRQKGAATFEVLTTTTTNSYVDDVTEENLVFYEYRIRAYKGTVYTEYSSIATAAKDLKGEAVSAYTTNLSWIKISNASKYKVYIVDEGQNYELGSYSWAEKVTVKTNSYINYKAGREYKYYIEAYDKNGVLLYTSSQISLATKPDALTMTASYVNDVLSISFANGLGAEQILVYRSVQENEEGNEIFATIDMNAEETIFTDSAFDYGVQKYYYHFYPATMLDNGTYVKGECLTYTLERKLETNTGIKTATVAGENAIAITWDEWNGADSYTVYRSETTKDNYVTLAEGITEVSYKDTDVILGKTYYYKVLVNKNGLSSSLEDTKENFLQLIPSTPELYSAATGSEIIIRNNPSLEYALLKTESDALAEYGSGEEDVLDGENVLRFSILPNTRYYIYARTKTEVTGEAPVRCALPLVVNTPVKVELVISSDEFVITKGNQVSYTLTMKPDNIHYTDDVTWTAVDGNENAYLTETKNDSVYVKDSLGNSIIRITKNKIIAIGDSSEKEVYLTATKGSMNTNCHVIVNVPVTGLSWHVGEVNGEAPESTDIEALDNLKVGDVAKIGVNYQPENADDTTVYFSSSNSNILKVTSDSNNFVNLEAVSNGKCILSAYTADGVKISTLITVDVAGITYGMWISDTDIEGETVTRDESGIFVGENINNLPEYPLDIKGESAPQSMQISAYLLNETSVTSKDENATVTGGILVKAENGTDVTYAS